MTRKYYSMETEVQSVKSFLIGSKLGDGAFIKRTPRHNTYISFKHAEDQFEYLTWKFNFMSDFVRNKTIRERNFTEGKLDTWQRQFYFNTISIKEFNYFYDLSFEQLIELLDEFSFVVWLLDDGNCYKKGWKLSTGNMHLEQQRLVEYVIKSRLNIDCFLYEHPTNMRKNYINIRSTNFELIKNMILKYIPCNIDIIINKIYQ